MKQFLLILLLLLFSAMGVYSQSTYENIESLDSIVQSDVDYIVSTHINSDIVECSYFVYCDVCGNTYFSYEKFPLWWVLQLQEELKKVKPFEGIQIEMYCPEDCANTSGHMIYLHIVEDVPTYIYRGNKMSTFND